VASAPSASRSPAVATPASASAPSSALAAADVTAVTTRDDFLLELGQTLGGKAAVRPVESLEAALTEMARARRGQVLVMDTREIGDVRAAVESARSSPAHPVVLVFAESPAEKELGAALKGSKVFAVLPLPIDARKTQAVLDAAIAQAIAQAVADRAAPAAHAAPAPLSAAGIDALRPARAAQAEPAASSALPRRLLIGAGAGALALIACGAVWFSTHRSHAPSVNRAAPAGAAPAAATGAASEATASPAAEASLVQGKVDELLEKARLAMHERRFSEPAGDNALLYYRSAAAADAGNAEARDGLQRVAGVLAARFEEALSGGRLDEAAATLAGFKSAAPDDARFAPFEQRLYAAQIARAIADGNFDRAAAVVHQAQQSGAVPAEQVTRWRAEIARRQEDARVQRLADSVEDRIREGMLADGDDSALAYLEQLQAAAPANAATERAERALVGACLRKAREAGLARNGNDEDRWVAAARSAGAKPAEISAFQKDLAGARAKAAQAESERLLGLARERMRDGRLTDPAQDSAAAYLTQLQASDPANPAIADAGHELAKALLDRARAAVLGGKSADADLAQAKHWGADPKELAAAAQSQPKATAPIDTAALAASLKRLRSPPPDYPVNALQQRIAGSVLLEFTVDLKGEPRDIHVLESTPPQVFDQAAVNAIRHWRYAPMIVNGTAVEVPVKTRMRFELPK
jgi:TonB family protein